METKAPIYVKIQDYTDAVSSIETLERKLSEARNLLSKLNDLKSEEDKELVLWAESLDEVSNRMEIIRQNLVQ